jgi:hypothetical protein
MMTCIHQWGARWLNPTSKIILIKFALSSLTIFQCVALLAPKEIFDQMAGNIRNFLWEGGNTNTKKFHLVNWSTSCLPMDRGGLAIRDS